MKKHLIATAMLAACGLASAQSGSSVTAYGLLDLSVSNFKGASSGVNGQDRTVNQLVSGAMSTSHIGFRGNEDLGGGWSAQFDLSSFVRVDTGAPGRSDAIAAAGVTADPFWSRQSWVGLNSASLGRIRLGNTTTQMFVSAITSNAFADSTVYSPLVLVTFIGSPLTGGTGWTNQIAYDSPVMGGFSFGGAVSASENSGGRNISGRAGYAAGPAAVSLTYQKVKKNPTSFADGTSPNNTNSWLAAGSWNFGVARVFAHLGQISNKGTETAPADITYKIWDVSASVPVGAGAFLVGYGSRKTKDVVPMVPATVAGGNLDRKVVSLGYDLYLSKRTDLYAMAMRDQTKTRTLPAPGTVISATGNNFGVGVRHRF